MKTTTESEIKAIAAARYRVVLLAVAEFIEDHGYSPTVRELMPFLGFESTSTMHHNLGALRARGYVDWVEGCPRTLHLLPAGFRFLEETS